MGRDEVDEHDAFVKRIHEKVEEVNRDAEVTEIMTLEEELKIRWHYGYDEGKAAGLEKGAAQEKREIAKSMINKIYPIKWTQQEEGFLENGHKKKG